MSLKKRVAFTLIFTLVFNFLGSSVAFSETGFKAIGIKDNTKVILNQYKSKNGFQYLKEGVIYTTPAFDFHIFSKEANLNAHTNGNIATKDLVTNSAFGTSQATDLKLNEENYFMNSAKGINNIASDGNIIVGTNVPTSLEDNNNKVNIGVNGNGLDQIRSSNVYKETSGSINYIDIDAEFENLKIISNLFSNNKTSNGVTLSTLNGENQTITLDGNLGDTNNYYLNVKASEISNAVNKRVINIKIPERKTLIINVDMAGLDINYLQNLVTVINNHSNAEDVVRYENNVLWNLYDSSAADKLFSTGDKYASVGTSDYFMGTILAPNANIKYGAVNGSVIANKTQQNGQESHKWTFTGHSTESIKGTSAVIEGTKKLSGKTLEAAMFSFNLLNESGNILQTAKNDADGKIKFSPINFNKIGTYTYRIEEVNEKMNGIIYDSQVVDVIITVTDNGEGELKANVKYPNKQPIFNNGYKAGAISAAIEGLKILTGKTLEAGMFSFNLLDENGTVLQTVKNDKAGAIKFTPISYDSVGDYKYKVQEVKGSLNGITYDEKVFNVTVSVSDYGNGNLVAKAIYPEGKIEFTNKYEAKGTSANLEATKILKGKDLKANMFEFQLKDGNNEIIEKVKNDADGKIKFSPINFNKIGTYTYKIEEVNGKMNGIIYDSQAVDVIITVTDNGEGELKADVKYPNKQPVFNNGYKAGATSAAIEGLKILTGKTLEAGVFSFNLLDENGTVLQTVKNDKDGAIKFTTISYDTVGNNKYKVQEVKGSLNGVTYDEKVFNVTVNVSDDGNGNLVANVAYPEGKIEFTNKYETKGTSVNLEATKILKGKDLKANMFEFQLKDGNNEIIEKVKNDIDGKIKFSPINFNKVGTYTYKIEEVNGKINGITYDTKVFDVTVNVSDDGNGSLVAKVIYPEEKIEFINKYEAKGTSAAIEGSKILTGKTLETDMFSFNLLDENENILQTVKNDKDGNIKFSPINFNKVGTYNYKIEEVNGKMNGIIYDSQVVDVIITVTDNGEGELEADVKYPNKQPVFNNGYRAGATSAAIEGNKILTGKTLETGMFSFNLLDETGKLLQTVKNDKNGVIKFDSISYDKVGDYKYKVQEVKGNLNGITYDTKVFYVIVNISDDGNGNLVAKVIYSEGKIIFENKVIKGNLEITKIDYENGKYLENAEFTIRDAEGKIVAIRKTDKNGKVLFEGLEYGKYTYEETAQPKGYILDNKKYSFEIKEDGVVVKYTMTNKKDPVGTITTNNSNTPNTGDSGIATTLIILILGVGGLFINNKRRIKNKIS